MFLATQWCGSKVSRLDRVYRSETPYTILEVPSWAEKWLRSYMQPHAGTNNQLQVARGQTPSGQLEDKQVATVAPLVSEMFC